jgi:lysophospholipase L1-like esterase
MAPLLALVAFVSVLSPGQQATQVSAPFAQDIKAFKARDDANPPAKGQILFIGSSSFTKWGDVSSYFPNYQILNRAFGGSSLPDVIRYADDVIFPYEPKQIVIYCGENDFAGDPKLEPSQVVDRFKALFRLIRRKLPNIPIAYISMKPSPSRWLLRDKFIVANKSIAEFCARQRSVRFIDVWNAMLDDHGQPKAEIFSSDRLHMNPSGYRIWQPIIEPYLVK